MKVLVSAFLSDLWSAAFFEHQIALVSATLLFLGSVALGLLAVPSKFASPALRALAGFPFFFLLWGGGSFIVYVLGGSSAIGGIIGILVATALIVIAFALSRFRDFFVFKELAFFLGLLLISLVLMFFGWGETNDGVVRAISGAWGDGALHTLNAEAFRIREGGDLTMPSFAGEYFREPVGYDFMAGMLRNLGFTIGGAFTLSATTLLAALFSWTGKLTAYLIGKDERYLENHRSHWLLRFGVFLSCLLIVFGGGLQWIVMAQRTESWSLSRFFGIHDPVWDKVENLGLIWANHLNTFASQKHLLLAAAFLSVLACSLHTLTLTARRKRQRILPSEQLLLMVLAVATIALPLFHAHAFIAAGLLWFSFWIVTRSRHVFLLGLFIFLGVLPVFFWYRSAVQRPGFIEFKLGYLAPPGLLSWLLFWGVNLGFFLPVVAWAFRRNSLGQSRWLLGLPAIALFALGNIVQFQSYLWDNYKIFLFAWLILLPLFISEIVLWLCAGGKTTFVILRRIAVIGVVGSMCFTTLSETMTYFNFRAKHPLYTSTERTVAAALERLLPPGATVLAATETVHRHPLTLTGRNLVCGYGGWIWTRGLNVRRRVAHIQRILSAPTREKFCEEARSLSITHIVIGREERNTWLGRASRVAIDIMGLDVLHSDTPLHVVDILEKCGRSKDFSNES